MPRLHYCLAILLLLSPPVARADDTATSSTTTGTTADPRPRFRMQRAESPQGAGAKTSPLGAPQGAGAKMTPVSAPQGAGAKVTPMSATEGQGKYQIKRMSDLHQDTGGTAGASTTNAGSGIGIGLGGSQRRPADTSKGQASSTAAPGLHGSASFRGGRPIGGGTKHSTSAP